MKLVAPLLSTTVFFLLLLSTQPSSCHASQQRRILQKRALGLVQRHGSRVARKTAATGRTSVANVVTASSSVAILPISTSSTRAAAATTATVAQQQLQQQQCLMAIGSPSSQGFLRFSHRATQLQQRLQRSFSLRAIFLDAITNKPGSTATTSTTASSSSKSGTSTTSSTTAKTNRHSWQRHHHATTASEELRTMMMSTTRPLSFLPGPALWHDVQRIAGGTVSESWNGFVGGYLLATGLDITKRLYWKVLATSLRPSPLAVASAATGTGATGGASLAAAAATASSLHQLPYPGLQAFSKETLLMHARSRQFGLEWAQMSAVFCASRGVVKTVRQRRRQQQQEQTAPPPVNQLLDDEWDTVLGGGLAGAVFSALARKGPVAMTQGALLYGTTMFALHPQLWKSGMQAMMLTPPCSSVVADTGVAAIGSTNIMNWMDGME